MDKKSAHTTLEVRKMTEKNTNLMGKVNIIALATDGSEYSDGAVQEAIFLAQACGAQLVVLSVINTDTETATSAHATAVTLRQEIKGYIDKIQQMATDNDIECEVVIEESRQPDKTLVELAYKYNADLFIMGRHGRGGLLTLMVGSMTSKVIGHGFPKVLVVPKGFTLSGQRILLATDGSPFSRMAVEEAVSMTKNCSAIQEVYVISVAGNEEEVQTAGELVDDICKTIQEKDVHAECTPIVSVGRPSDVIADTAREKNIDMVIIGGHGKGLTKLLMGHVTEKVIAKTHCAVLVVEKDK